MTPRSLRVEDLTLVPRHENRIRRVGWSEGWANRFAAAIEQLPGGPAVPSHPAGYQDLESSARPFQAQRAAVKRLVVQRAQCQPVRHHVSAIVGMPLDVGRLQPEHPVAEAGVMVAHSAAVVVGGKDISAKPRIPGEVLSDSPAPARHGFHEIRDGEKRAQPHGLQNVAMDRRRKVMGQDLVGGPRHERRLAAKQVVHLFAEASGDADTPCFFYAEVLVSRGGQPGFRRARKSSGVTVPFRTRGQVVRSRLRVLDGACGSSRRGSRDVTCDQHVRVAQEALRSAHRVPSACGVRRRRADFVSSTSPAVRTRRSSRGTATTPEPRRSRTTSRGTGAISTLPSVFPRTRQQLRTRFAFDDAV